MKLPGKKLSESGFNSVAKLSYRLHILSKYNTKWDICFHFFFLFTLNTVVTKLLITPLFFPTDTKL